MAYQEGEKEVGFAFQKSADVMTARMRKLEWEVFGKRLNKVLWEEPEIPNVLLAERFGVRPETIDKARQRVEAERKKLDKMCSYFDEDRGVSVKHREVDYHAVHPKAAVRKLQRKRVVCPRCGRRLLGWIAVGYDDKLRYVIPRHKRKGWWKKAGDIECHRKKQKTSRCVRRRRSSRT